MAFKLDDVRDILAGRYEVERVLGHGAMAIVFLAHSPKYDGPVAIKILHPEFASTLLARRFHREIAILSDLDHPNILTLMDSEEAAPLLYYVMPYADGGSLQQRLQRERHLSLDAALQVTRDVAAALDYAHDHDVIHRDIKPENIMFVGGDARVCDFGVARAMVRAGGERLSSSGLVLGTPHYMSPEQASGETSIDARSDIYSLGCVVYEMLVGEPPFTGRTSQAVMARHVNQAPPSLLVVRPDLPGHVEAAIHHALEKEPNKRPKSGGDLVEELRD